MNDYEKVSVIWCDENIGCLECHQLLKRAFVKVVSQEWNHTTVLDDTTVELYVQKAFSQNSYHYETAAIDFYAFSKMEDCIKCIEEQQDKRIFLVVSSTLSRPIVQQIRRRCSDVLLKSDDPQLRSVYVLRSISPAIEEVLSTSYTQYFQNFQDEANLLKHLMEHIVRYFITLGQRQYEHATTASIFRSLQYYKWAGILLKCVFGHNAEYVCKRTLNDLNTHIALSEAVLRDTFNVDINQLCCDPTQQIKPVKPNGPSSLNNIVHPIFTVVTDDENNSGMEMCLNNTALISTKDQMPCQIQPLMDDGDGNTVITVYLRVPLSLTDNFKSLQALLMMIFPMDLVITLDASEYLNRIKEDVPSIIIQTLSSDDDKEALEDICCMDAPIALYILGTEPSTSNDRRDFFTTYSQVRAIASDPTELVTKVVLDVVLKCRVMGAHYAKDKDKNRATIAYDQCIRLLNQLNTVIQQRQLGLTEKN